jgi:hypothetical protein
MPKRKTAEDVLSAIAALSPEEVRRLCGMVRGDTHLLGEYAILPNSTVEEMMNVCHQALDMAQKPAEGEGGVNAEQFRVMAEALGFLTDVCKGFRDSLAKRTLCIRARTVVARRNQHISNLRSQGMTEPEAIRGHLIEHHPELMRGRSKDGKKEFIRADMMMRAYDRAQPTTRD